MNSQETKFLLPRKHLSWSQLDLWHKNKDRYRREYFENGKKLDTKYLQFGKGIAKLIEEGKHKELLPDLVVYEKPEFEIRTTIRGVPVLCYLDSYGDKDGLIYNTFREYKTGKVPWDQARVQKHGQLLYYAAALKAATGECPWSCDLDWIETTESVQDADDFWAQVDKKLAITGKIKSFHREFDEREVERMENLIEQTAKEISAAYEAFINEI